RIFPVAPRFRSEAGCICRHLYRQHRAIKDLAGINIRQRHLSGWYEVKLPFVGELEQVLLKLRQLTGSKKSLGINYERWQPLLIPVPLCLQIQAKTDQRPFKPRTEPF